MNPIFTLLSVTPWSEPAVAAPPTPEIANTLVSPTATTTASIRRLKFFTGVPPSSIGPARDSQTQPGRKVIAGASRPAPPDRDRRWQHPRRIRLRSAARRPEALPMDEKTLDSIPVVSADCHVAEPAEELTARVPPALRDKAPRIEERDGVRRVVFPTLDDPSLVDIEGPTWEPDDEDDFSPEHLKRLKRRK